MEKISFILYMEYADKINMLSDEEAGQLFKAIFAFLENGERLPLSPMGEMAFSFISGQLLRDREKWVRRVERQSAAAHKTNELLQRRREQAASEAYPGEPAQRKIKNAERKNENAKRSDNEHENETENEYEKDNENENEIENEIVNEKENENANAKENEHAALKDEDAAFFQKFEAIRQYKRVYT